MEQCNFIVGNWYKSKYSGNYYKFKEFKNDYFYSSEEIKDNKWVLVLGVRVWFGFFDVSIELSEIQEFLPDNHPDKIIISSSSNEDYSYLTALFEKYNIE